MNQSGSKRSLKMDPIDETSVLETTTVATEDSPSRKSINTATSSSESQFSSVDTLHNQLQMIEEAEMQHTLSRAQHLQEEVLENPQKPVPPVIFKYILIGMGLCGVLIGIVLGAIIGQHMLQQGQQDARYRQQPPPSLNSTSSQAPSPAAPNLVWYYPPTPSPSSDIFNHSPSPVRTVPPMPSMDNPNATLMPTTNSTSFQNETSTNETSDPVTEEDQDSNLNETNADTP